MGIVESVLLAVVVAAVGFAVFKAKSNKAAPPSGGVGGSGGDKPPVEQK